MADGGKLLAKVPSGWKISFSMGVVIPYKMKNCGDCRKDSLSENCDKLVNQRKTFSENLKGIAQNQLIRKKNKTHRHVQ